MPVRRHLAPSGGEVSHELRDGVGDEADEHREHHEAEENLKDKDESQAVVGRDVLDPGGDDELEGGEHAVSYAVLPEDLVGGVVAQHVPQHAHRREHRRGDDREQEQREPAVRRDAVLEAVSDVVIGPEARVGVLGDPSRRTHGLLGRDPGRFDVHRREDVVDVEDGLLLFLGRHRCFSRRLDSRIGWTTWVRRRRFYPRGRS